MTVNHRCLIPVASCSLCHRKAEQNKGRRRKTWSEDEFSASLISGTFICPQAFDSDKEYFQKETLNWSKKKEEEGQRGRGAEVAEGQRGRGRGRRFQDGQMCSRFFFFTSLK